MFEPLMHKLQEDCDLETGWEMDDFLTIGRNMKLIREKMIIPAEFPHLVRNRLLNTLSENLQNYVATVIVGRAGTGKTMLVADFARGCGRRVAWYKVDAPEVELRWFLHYLVASLAEQCPEIDVRTLKDVIQRIGAHDLSTLAEVFAHELQKQAIPLLLVIDDLHLVYDAHWLTPYFHRLLTLLSEETHLLILTRSLPPTPLWRLRSKQRLCVLTEAELAFTTSEAHDLFANYGLAAGQVGAALEQSNGRVGALAAYARRASSAGVTL